MTDPDLTSEQYERHREAGAILTTVREETINMLDVGVDHLELATFAENRIRELGGKPAFPINISIDEEAAHGTPAADEDSTFGEELVNLDFGVHVDGWIADSAVTVDLRGDKSELVEASEAALAAAIALVEPGVETGELGAAIEDEITDRGYNPIVNLSGHGLDHYEQHTTPNIPNRAVAESPELSVGDVVAIEPFATDGSGKVKEGNRTEIYSLETERQVRNRDAQHVLDQITSEFKTLPFAARWLDTSRAKMALRRLEMNDIIHGYPVLKEADGTFVSQAEHTVIVTPDGCEVTTESSD